MEVKEFVCEADTSCIDEKKIYLSCTFKSGEYEIDLDATVYLKGSYVPATYLQPAEIAEESQEIELTDWKIWKEGEQVQMFNTDFTPVKLENVVKEFASWES